LVWRDDAAARSQGNRRAVSSDEAPVVFFFACEQPGRGGAGLREEKGGGRLDAVRSSLLDEIRKLSLAERLQLVENVWDSIAAEGGEFPIPASHREELARRRQEHRRSPEDVVPWEEVRRQLWAEE